MKHYTFAREIPLESSYDVVVRGGTPAGVRRLGGWPRRSINAPRVYDFAPGEVAAVPTHCRLELGKSALELALVGAVEDPLLVDSRLQAEQAWAGVIPAAGTAMALYPVALSPDQSLHFVMRLGPTTDTLGETLRLDAAGIDLHLADGARHRKCRVPQRPSFCPRRGPGVDGCA